MYVLCMVKNDFNFIEDVGGTDDGLRYCTIPFY